MVSCFCQSVQARAESDVLHCAGAWSRIQSRPTQVHSLELGVLLSHVKSAVLLSRRLEDL